MVNPAEAELVRLIFRRFLDLGSALLLIRELNAEGHRTESWTTRAGNIRPAGTRWTTRTRSEVHAVGPITRQLAETKGRSTLAHEEGDHAGAGCGGRGGWRAAHERRQLVPCLFRFHMVPVLPALFRGTLF